MQIVITGSSGQIGTNLALTLMKRGRRVVGLDKRPNSWTRDVETRMVDLAAVARGQASFELPPRTDVIVHLAAHAKVHELVLNPAKALENMEMVAAALEMARRSKTPIIFGSSREVYGDIQHHVTNETMTDFVVAKSPYSASKIAGEALVSSYAHCYGLPTLVFRFSNVYGRFNNDLERMERVIPLFVRRIYDGRPIKIYGPTKTLDFTYVDDCVSGILAGIDALLEGRVVNQTFNLASGQGQTLSDLVALIELGIGRKAQAIFEEARPGEVTRYIADLTKATEQLGYRTQTPLAAGIVKYLEWLRAIKWIEGKPNAAQPSRSRPSARNSAAQKIAKGRRLGRGPQKTGRGPKR